MSDLYNRDIVTRSERQAALLFRRASGSWSTRPNWTGRTSPKRSRARVTAICTPSHRG